MQSLVIEGKNKLSGEIRIQGAKNSALPILSAAVLAQGEIILTDCPQLTDVYSAERILTYLGCGCSLSDNTAVIKNNGIQRSDIPEKLMSEMRSSIIFMGALIGRSSECSLSFPGGCELGARPIDMHISALKKMGVNVVEEFGRLECKAEKLHGAKILLPFPSVGATENIILAASLAKGGTQIKNAAREPEIVDLARFLNACGAKISGAGEGTIYIEGVESLHGCEYRIMPDRIAAATYMSAAAATGGELTLTNIEISHIDSIIPVFEEMGCYMYNYGNSLYIKAKKLHSVRKILTMPYPSFPTDAQAVIMAVLCKAQETSVIVENIFENRYRHVPALVKMGADIKVEGKAAVIEGVSRMFGANVAATDLRGGAALVVAGLGAEGETVVSDIAHIDRGYERIEEVISSVGGKIVRK